MRLFLRSIEVATDARLQRYTAALRKQGRAYAIGFWQRGPGDPATEGRDELIPFRRPAPIGARWGNLVGLIAWNLFVARSIWRLRRVVSGIHAVDLDTALTAYFCAAVLRIPLIVDFYDSYPDSRGMRGTTATLMRRLEGWLAGRAGMAIIADRARLAQHAIRSERNVLVVENVPALEWIPTPVDAAGPLTLGYLGNLEARHRGLEDVLAIVEADHRYRMLIAGAGALERQVAEAAARCDRIQFYGPVEHQTGMELMARCHIVLGLYYLSVANHRFAAPNKYYEHLVLGRPLLTTRGTPPGEKVERHRTGWAVDDDATAIADKLAELADNRPEIIVAGARARALWDTCYGNYVATQIDGAYVQRGEAIER